jgi:transketolase
MVAKALEAAELLAADGVSARVVNVSSLKPIDAQTLTAAAEECGAVVTMEEHSVIGGLGAAVCELLAGVRPVPVLRLGIEDLFGQSGAADELLEHYGLTAAHAVELARRAIAMKP